MTTILQSLHGTVLIVDDEEPVRDALAELLKHAGLQVLTASNGQKGIDCFRAYRTEIDLVILDMQMPVMSGPEALRSLRAIDPAVRIILSSGYSESVIDGLEPDGYTLFLQKPYELDALVEKVAYMLANIARHK